MTGHCKAIALSHTRFKALLTTLPLRSFTHSYLCRWPQRRSPLAVVGYRLLAPSFLHRRTCRLWGRPCAPSRSRRCGHRTRPGRRDALARSSEPPTGVTTHAEHKSWHVQRFPIWTIFVRQFYCSRNYNIAINYNILIIIIHYYFNILILNGLILLNFLTGIMK